MTTKAIFSDDSEALAHYGVLGMKWGVRNAETLAKYKSNGSQSAKSGLEDDFARKSTNHYRVVYRNGKEDGYYVHPTHTAKARAKSNRKVSKDRKLRKLNRNLVNQERVHGENSQQARAARKEFHEHAQSVVAKKTSRDLAKAYVKDIGLKPSRENVQKYENVLLSEVYMGPGEWTAGMDRKYAKSMGLDKAARRERWRIGS